VRKRFSPNVLLKYQFRGIEKFAPWINSVHFIVQSDSQVPAWLDRNSVRVVKHEDFIPQEFLPTYSSNTIECFLHRIPGLATCFIYANDDTYIINEVIPGDFFDGVMPRNSFRVSRVNPKRNESFQRMNMKITEFICSELGIRYEPYTMCLPHHVQKAMNKAIYKKIFDLYEEYIRSKITMFRTDDNISQAFFTMYYMLSTGLRYRHSLAFRRFDVFSNFDSILDFFANATKQRPKLLCINNNDNDRDVAIMCQFEKMLPTKSYFEL
jgi:hypothetical protein